MTQRLVVRCVAFALKLVATQSNARIDVDSILAFLRVALLQLIMENLNIFMFRKCNIRALRHIVNRA